jgi:predicted phosphate transport protein (TIGR00153 family)
MAFSFIPKEEKFFELFETQAAHNVQAAQVFAEMIKNWSLESPAIKNLQDIEHEADITTHEIYDKLNRTFITPFDREDIRDLAAELDDVVDLIQSIAIRMQLYRVGRATEEMGQLSEILLRATENVRKAIAELQNPEKQRRVLDYCIEINSLENAGDRALEVAIGKLFQGTPDPLEVIKHKEIYEGIETAIDKCEDVAHTLETILVKHS